MIPPQAIFSWLASRGIYITLDANRELIVIDAAKADPKIVARIEANREKLTEYLNGPFGVATEVELGRGAEDKAVWRPRGTKEWIVLPEMEHRRFWDSRFSRSRSAWPNREVQMGGMEADQGEREAPDQLPDGSAGEVERPSDVVAV